MEKSEEREKEESEFIEFLRDRIRLTAIKMFNWPLLPHEWPEYEDVVRKFEGFVFGLDDHTPRDAC